MVKGVSRQVVLVRPNDSDLFEQAIFLVRGDKLAQGEITDEMLLRQAENAARRSYADAQGDSSPLGLFLGAILGGGMVGLLWLLVSIL